MILSSDKRGRSNLGCESGGGKAEPGVCGCDPASKSGEVGLTVYENGVGAEGGGRWMNVKSSGSDVVTAWGLFKSGSGCRIGGFWGSLVA